jgi:hypothetical protein
MREKLEDKKFRFLLLRKTCSKLYQTPDPHSSKTLDPDPHIINADPKHWAWVIYPDRTLPWAAKLDRRYPPRLLYSTDNVKPYPYQYRTGNKICSTDRKCVQTTDTLQYCTVYMYWNNYNIFRWLVPVPVRSRNCKQQKSRANIKNNNLFSTGTGTWQFVIILKKH